MEKEVTIKVYRPTGEFLKIWENARFVGFTKQINGGLGPCEIELGETMDYSGDDLKLNNEVKIFINDKDTAGIWREEGDKRKLIYSGYISMYKPWVDKEGWEGVTVNLLGYYTKFAQDIWRRARVTTFDYAGDATDIGTIFRTLIDDYQDETINPKINYAQGSLTLTSTTTEYKFEFVTYREAIDILKELAPPNWWWYVDEWGTIYFETKPTTPTHEFIIGRHIGSLKIERSLEKAKNVVFFYDDGTNSANKILKCYADNASTAEYDRRVVKMIDNRVKVSTDIDKFAEGFISEHKDPDIKVIAEILDNNENEYGYDIESINPGETCRFLNLDQSLVDIVEDNMLITKVEYSLDKVILEVEPMEAGVILRQEETSERVDEIAKAAVPTSFSR